ncbi:MAG: hypothetical protein Q9195_000157 [Heterodermia aff. obscurata]
MASRYNRDTSDRLEQVIKDAEQAIRDAENNRGKNQTGTVPPSPRQAAPVPRSDRIPRPSVACGTAFTPDFQRVLDYQRALYRTPAEPVVEVDPKAAERGPGEIVNRFCNICSDAPGKQTWCVHLEHEGVTWDLFQDAERFRGLLVIEGKRVKVAQPKIKHSLRPFFRMIHPLNLCTLLTENAQGAAAHWIVFTTNGTLIGYSEGTAIEQGRTVAALTGAAWRINNNLVVQGSEDIPDSGPFLKNIAIFPYHDLESPGAGLKSMLAEVNGMVIAVHDVKERLLVAAMHPLAALKTTEADKVSEKMKSLHVFDETDPAAKESKGSEEGEAGKKAGSSTSRSSDKSRSESMKSSKSQAKSKGKGKAAGDEDTEEQRFSMKELLMMKVEGMVDVLRADLVDFKMPDEFY